MFTYKTQQKVFEIGGVKFGSQAFENPPVLVGTVFYHGHKIVSDPRKGEFDKAKAEELIRNVEEASSKTRVPAVIDVTAESSEAMAKYLEFVVNVTKLPIFIDSPSIDVAKAGFQFAKEAGLLERVAYNSITAKSKDEEYRLLQEYGVEAVVALLYTDRVIDVDARLKALETILSKASTYGIEKLLIDTFVIDIPSLSAACRAMIEVKARYGLPVGMGAHNAVSSQKKALKERFSAEGYKACELTSNLMSIALGADFLLYGPVEVAKEVFPAVYTIYTAYRYLARRKENLIQL
jgi:tetrahydromethanopterin S-methyltransferase subunit H